MKGGAVITTALSMKNTNILAACECSIKMQTPKANTCLVVFLYLCAI